MLSISSGFNFYLCGEPVTLRYRHSGLRGYIKRQLHRDPTNGDIYIFLSKDSRRVRMYYFHHSGEILTEKILHADHFVEPVFDRKKGCYHISWESFVYLVEGIVPKDRRVDFDDLDAENAEETGREEIGGTGGKMPEDTIPEKVVQHM